MDDLNAIDRAYLLGDVSAEAAERLELEVMADAGVADRLAAAENDLIDDYLEGSLSAVLRQRFETVFMATPARADQVRFARELAARAAASRAPRRIKTAWPSWALLSVAASLIIAVGLWRQQSSAPVEPGMTATGTAMPSPTRRTFPFVLALISTRGGDAPSVSIPADAEDIVIQVDVAAESAFAAFDARITAPSESRDLWKSSETAPLVATNGTLSITVPASSGIGRRGTYELVLSGRNPPDARRLIAVVPFTVP